MALLRPVRGARRALLLAGLLGAALVPRPGITQTAADSVRLERLKAEALAKVDPKLVQELVDQLFSYSELGMQEFETQKYLTNLLKAKGFAITLGYAGMPSAWVARWESPAGKKPVITLGSDVDGIPQASNRPAVAFLDSAGRWCPRPRRRSQRRSGGEHRWRARREGADDP